MHSRFLYELNKILDLDEKFIDLLARKLSIFSLIIKRVFLFLSDGNLRLVGSSYSNHGCLEIYYNGVWGTVCDDGFNSTDARVACRQLGYSEYSRYGNVRTFG